MSHGRSGYVSGRDRFAESQRYRAHRLRLRHTVGASLGAPGRRSGHRRQAITRVGDRHWFEADSVAPVADPSPGPSPAPGCRSGWSGGLCVTRPGEGCPRFRYGLCPAQEALQRDMSEPLSGSGETNVALKRGVSDPGAGEGLGRGLPPGVTRSARNPNSRHHHVHHTWTNVRWTYLCPTASPRPAGPPPDRCRPPARSTTGSASASRSCSPAPRSAPPARRRAPAPSPRPGRTGPRR